MNNKTLDLIIVVKNGFCGEHDIRGVYKYLGLDLSTDNLVSGMLVVKNALRSALVDFVGSARKPPEWFEMYFNFLDEFCSVQDETWVLDAETFALYNTIYSIQVREFRSGHREVYINGFEKREINRAIKRIKQLERVEKAGRV